LLTLILVHSLAAGYSRKRDKLFQRAFSHTEFAAGLPNGTAMAFAPMALVSFAADGPAPSDRERHPAFEFVLTVTSIRVVTRVAWGCF
jgi:hypothetical protein